MQYSNLIKGFRSFGKLKLRIMVVMICGLLLVAMDQSNAEFVQDSVEEGELSVSAALASDDAATEYCSGSLQRAVAKKLYLVSLYTLLNNYRDYSYDLMLHYAHLSNLHKKLNEPELASHFMALAKYYAARTAMKTTLLQESDIEEFIRGVDQNYCGSNDSRTKKYDSHRPTLRFE